MKKKEFKAESKKLMDLMINSIYTNKEIFLREIISNASDAIDKLYYNSLTNTSIKINHKNLEINIKIDKDHKTLTISDNGIGMSKEELESNLGTIAKSGSLSFKEENEKKKDIDIIGQFGVGFYSSFMVSDKVEVISRSYGSDEAYIWTSEGIDGYTIEKTSKDTYGTDVILHIKDNCEEYEYEKYLDSYEIQSLIKKYSDYITYPIKMEVEHSHLKPKDNENDKDEYETVKEIETINSLIPIWKRDKKKIKEEEYNTFYSDKFNDYEKPLKYVHTSVEGLVSYNSILYIPSHASFDYYSKDFEKGLQLYSNGVLIMEKCSDLLPDYFSFIKGVVDSPDLSLNISRETLQQSKTLKTIASNIEKKIKSTLEEMINKDREKYEEFYKAFGMQLKFGIYNNFGIDKEKLQDLLLFYSSNKKKLITLKEYIKDIKNEQNSIYYACGETIDKIDMLPQVESVKEKGYDILYLTEYVDEFALKTIMNYDNKNFLNVCTDTINLDSDEEKEAIKNANIECKEIFDLMKSSIDNVKEVRFTNKLKKHPVCLTSEGDISIEMEKVINSMPTDEKIKASTILEINVNHPIAEKIKKLYKENKDELKKYSKILYSQARLIEGLSIENPTEISSLICDYLSK
ncbi:MAG: molecular chaperone HtpG [bacterium]|nr:molecular chaperone HtpG [bacterium]